MEENISMPRERISAGEISQMSVEELLCAILGRGMQGKSVFALAKEISELLDRKTSMPGMDELLAIKGLGAAKAAQVLACLELSGRFMLGKAAGKASSAAELAPRLAFMKLLKQESMVAVTLNNANRIIKIRTVSIGSVNSAPAHPREAYAPAVEDRAAAVVFAHNHPSGSLEPSANDFAITERLLNAGILLGIPMMDHLIISPRGYLSMKSKYPEFFVATPENIEQIYMESL